MGILKALIIVIVLGVLSWGFYDLNYQKRMFANEVREFRAKTKALAAENKTFEADIEYFKNPANLLKELKSQFNYREEGEKLIIIVPPSENSATTTR